MFSTKFKTVMEKDYFTVQEIAEQEDCSTKTVLRKIRDGKIPEAILEGRSYRIPKESYENYAKGKETHRRFITERAILRGASSSISILGINSLGILHQNREMLINKLNEGVKIRLLLLDPDSKHFSERVDIEENINGKVSGRLRAESIASYAICKDIYNFVSSPNQENFSLSYFSADPKMALIMADHQKANGYCSVNFYPHVKKENNGNLFKDDNINDDPISNLRGLCGEYLHFPKTKEDRISFQHFIETYNTLMEGAKNVDLSKDIDFS